MPRSRIESSKKRGGEGSIYGDDYVCFVCKDGGTLVLCDQSKCSKGYHAECIDKKLQSLRRGIWHCGRHFCSNCWKSSSDMFNCVMCPTAFCSSCYSVQVMTRFQQNGITTSLCNACLPIVKMIELDRSTDENGNAVNFDDSSTLEYLFKEYWFLLKWNCCYTAPFISDSAHSNEPACAEHHQHHHQQQQQEIDMDVNGEQPKIRYFSRSELLQLIHDPMMFTKAVVGAYVKVKALSKDGSVNHRLVQIKEVVLPSDSYAVGDKNTNVVLEVKHGERTKRIKISHVSDHLLAAE